VVVTWRRRLVGARVGEEPANHSSREICVAV
jgi:hypothetical protein